MGKLILADTQRAGKARAYLEKALSGRERLSPSMASDVVALMQKVQGN
jgi:hypothetical protein